MSSEGSPPRPTRRIRRVLVESSSGSDSDESVGTARTRKKRLRVVSEEDASDSSGSSILEAGARRRRLPRVRDSGDSDSSGSVSPSPDPTPAPARPASGFSSDSSEGNSDKCSICLMRFTDQQVGTPQTCEHIFCLDCITEWSKNVNTCPVDRITFDAIVVRSCIGGRVLKTEPVKVTERRSSVDLLVVEDPTVCEICGSSDSEETMLLCDGCDLGYHMACLTPPLEQIPVDQWFCGECAGDTREEDFIYLSEVNDLLLDMEDIERPLGPRQHPLRQPRAARRSPRTRDPTGEPSTSRGRGGPTELGVEEVPSTSRRAPAPRPAATAPRRAATTRARRKYKRRRTKTVVIEYEVEGDGKFPITKRIKRRVKKRKSRARPRTAARRTHVRQSVRAQLAALRGDARAGSSAGVQALSLLRHSRAGVPSLSLFGNRHELDYFSGEDDASENAAAAVVARRPAHAVAFSAYRQARRKMVSIPSPPCASAAPDILSSIMDSQTLLHSKRSVVSVTVDGRVNIQLRTAPAPASTPADKLDLTKGEDSTRKAPSYPGQSRGHGGGWGGGYRGNYHREQGSTFNRGSYEAGNYRGGQQGYGGRPHAGGEGNGFNNAWRGEQEYDDFPRRPRPYGEEDDERSRQSYPPRGRRSIGAAWPPARPDPPPPQRHSFGGFEDALDMRTGAGDGDGPVRPLPEPPVFKFKSTDVDEEEAGLVIDTDKYDPTEPTRDEDSGDEAARGASPPPLPPAPSPPPALSHILAGLDTSAISVPAGVLDSAVRQVLQEHRGLVAPSGGDSDDDDGDCPNFSIYSATSVHIANTSNSGNHPAASPPPPDRHDRELVQRGGDTPDPPPLPPLLTAEEEQFKEKISKRCPITPNTRDPIKIKLNTPSLIKRVSLYDEDDEPFPEPEDEAPSDQAPEDEAPSDQVAEPEDDVPSESDDTPHADESTKDDAVEQSVGDEESSAAGDAQNDAPVTLNDKDLDKDIVDEDVVEQKEDVTVEPDESRESQEQRDDAGTPELDAAHAHTDDDETDAEGSERDKDDVTEHELDLHSPCSKKELAEKMTESISETEDERSYTPCLDENKSKDTSLETDRGGDTGGIEGLDTELISEDEGNEMFSDTEGAGGGAEPGKDREEGEILDKSVLKDEADDAKKKKKKESKKDGKEKSKSKKKVDVAFKKLSKSGKERNYRDKDDKKKKSRSDSEDKSDKEKERNKREKRKDLERYDVRTVVTGKRARVTDAFGRDVSVSRSPSAPPAHSPPLEWPRRRSPSRPRRSSSKGRRSLSRPRRSLSRGRRSPSRVRKSLSPALSPPPRRSLSPRRRSPLKKRRKSLSPRRRSVSRVRKIRSRSVSPRRRRSLSRGRKRRRSPSRSPKPKPTKKKKRSRSERRSHSRPKDLDKEKKKRGRKRSRSARRKSPKQKKNKKRSPPLELSPPPAWSPPPPRAWSRSVDSRLLSPRTPPPDLSPDPRHLRVILANEDKQKRKKEKKRQREAEKRHRRTKDTTGPSKEVFTSGNNILVSVSFDKEGEDSGARRRRRGEKRQRRERRRQQGPELEGPKPVAIIDLERSPFRELTPSPKNVIVLSDSEPGDKEPAPAPAAAPAPPPPPAPAALTGPKTPPEPAIKFSIPLKPAPQLRANPLGDEEDPAEERGPNTPPSPPASPASSPDAYDPFEPTRSPSPPAADPPAAAPAEPASMTLEAAQRTNLSADEVLAQRPLTPSEKVMALLQSTRDVEVEAPPTGDAASAAEAQAESAPPTAAPTPPARPALAVSSSQRVVLPSPTKGSPLKSQPPKLFLAKPSPIKSTPIKPMQSTKISKLPLPHVKPVQGARKPRYSDVIDLELGDSPYSPGSSDFGDLFEPPAGRGGKGHDIFDTLLGGKKSKRDRNSAKVPVKQIKKKGNKLQVGVKLDENKLRILDELPSSAVELQVKSKFLKKLNRQERVVEEVKLVLKPHYNKKHLTKDEYKDVLRRAVPKICHNKSGEINPAKIQALVEAYVKKIRKRRKLGLA